MKNYLSEFAGSFGFVFIGCGAIVFAAPFIGYLGISIAFGLAFSAMGFAFTGHHFNPAVTLAAVFSKQFYDKNIWFTGLKAAAYILVQTAGACAAVFLIYYIYSGKTGYVHQGNLATNIVERYTLSSAFWLEAVLSFLFLCVFLGTNENKRNQATACGFIIIAAYLLSYPVTKGSLNPIRATATALFSGGTAMAQLPLFWAAPMLAAVVAGLFFNPVFNKPLEKD